ncbi:unnamed protein product [Prorocentrum cordatum]|uniref:RNA helicase n=1 Tax=Prorocentrum cordatum TaxID=2364126 RepID=A0ABN9SS57_9DINO|nr:unnamed protein product [Polarella glacialis]
MLDVDCDRLATLVGPEKQVLKLRKGDVLRGLKVVERRRKMLYVEFPGLSQFVEYRREPLDIHEFDETAEQALAKKALGHRIYRMSQAEEQGRDAVESAGSGSLGKVADRA